MNRLNPKLLVHYLNMVERLARLSIAEANPLMQDLLNAHAVFTDTAEARMASLQSKLAAIPDVPKNAIARSLIEVQTSSLDELRRESSASSGEDQAHESVAPSAFAAPPAVTARDVGPHDGSMST